MKLTLKLTLVCFSSLPSTHFGHQKLCGGTELPRSMFLVLPRCPDWIRMTSICFTLCNDRVHCCLQGLLDKNGKDSCTSCKASFYTETSSVWLLGKKIKWVRLKSFPNTKSHSSHRPQIGKIHRKLCKESSKTFHKVRDPRPFDDVEGNTSPAVGVCQ